MRVVLIFEIDTTYDGALAWAKETTSQYRAPYMPEGAPTVIVVATYVGDGFAVVDERGKP